MLAAALHLVQAVGPHVVELNEQIRGMDNVWATGAAGLRHRSPAMVSDIKRLLADHQATGTPLPMLEEHDVNRRLTAGWDASDPLLPVSTGVLARQAGYVQFWAKWMPHCATADRHPQHRRGLRRSSAATPPRPQPPTAQPCCRGHCHCIDPKRPLWSASPAPRRSWSWLLRPECGPVS